MRNRIVLLLCIVGVLAVAYGAVALPLPPINRDVAVDVAVFPPVVHPGQTAQVTLTVWNLGTLDDTARVTVVTRILGRVITKTQTVWLPVHGSMVITQNVPVPARAPSGEYPIVATAQLVPNPRQDSNLTNNVAEAAIVVD
jgi:hypothetical protein